MYIYVHVRVYKNISIPRSHVLPKLVHVHARDCTCIIHVYMYSTQAGNILIQFASVDCAEKKGCVRARKSQLVSIPLSLAKL